MWSLCFIRYGRRVTRSTTGVQLHQKVQPAFLYRSDQRECKIAQHIARDCKRIRNKHKTFSKKQRKTELTLRKCKTSPEKIHRLRFTPLFWNPRSSYFPSSDITQISHGNERLGWIKHSCSLPAWSKHVEVWRWKWFVYSNSLTFFISCNHVITVRLPGNWQRHQEVTAPILEIISHIVKPQLVVFASC